MIYVFSGLELDTDRRELRRGAEVLHIEPRVFDLAMLLVENHHRVLERDELIEKVWNGRIVSEWAIASQIKKLRGLLGDDGRSQRMVQTLRGKGFRFVESVQIKTHAVSSEPASDGPTQQGMPPSIAVLPFELLAGDEKALPIADAIPRELTTSLATLRWIKVIAQGSSFRFRGGPADVKVVGEVLGARYCLTGTVEAVGSQIMVDTEICDTRDRSIIWADRRAARFDEVQRLRADIMSSVLNVAELEIPRHEAQLTDFTRAENLDAWTAMHCGFQQMFRFCESGNARARRLFEVALAAEPGLSRAYAGMSFVSFQNAHMTYTDDSASEVARAEDYAAQAVDIQPHDPFANFVMGRSHWLRGDPEGGRFWFDRAVASSPNHAMATFGCGWTDVFTSNYGDGMRKADRAMSLSPLDPFRPGMANCKMWANIARDDYAEALKWAEIAARTPWSNATVAFMAAMCRWLNGDDESARAWITEANKRRNPRTGKEPGTLIPATQPEFQKLVAQAQQALIP